MKIKCDQITLICNKKKYMIFFYLFHNLSPKDFLGRFNNIVRFPLFNCQLLRKDKIILLPGDDQNLLHIKLIKKLILLIKILTVDKINTKLITVKFNNAYYNSIIMHYITHYCEVVFLIIILPSFNIYNYR